MKIIKVTFLVCFSIMIESCSSVQVVTSKNIEKNQFDQIYLGQSESEVKQIVGEASEIRSDNESNNWYYNNHDSDAFQRATVSFNLKSQKVVGILVIPLESEPEFNLSYLQSKKFPASDYIKAPLGRCHRDYFPREIFYISPSLGIIVVLDGLNNFVESYSQTSTQYASGLIQKIKNCER